MEFHVYTVHMSKLGTFNQVHTPSCRENESLKKKGAPYRKLQAPFVDDLIPAIATTTPIIVHDKCCKLFRKPTNANPPCPHCKHPDTVAVQKLDKQHTEYKCKSSTCAKKFVVKKERPMKVRIKKQKNNKAKEARQAKRTAAREARAQRKAERRKARAGRIAMRIVKQLQRMPQLGVELDDTVVTSFLKELADKTAMPKPAAAKKTAAKKPASKKTAAKTAPKKVAYAPSTNAPGQSAAKKTTRKK